MNAQNGELMKSNYFKAGQEKFLNKTFSEICVTTLSPLVYIVYLHYALSGSP